MLQKNKEIKKSVFIFILFLLIFSGFFLYFTVSAKNIPSRLYNNEEKSFNTAVIPVQNSENVTASVSKLRYVVPSGETFGVKMYTDGLLVIDTSVVIGADNREYFPAKDAGIKKGDRILYFNDKKIQSAEDFEKSVNSSNNEITLTILRNEEAIKLSVTPVISNDRNLLKLGLWVRDSTAGIGTMTFYDPETLKYAALGHGICDTDTKDIMSLSYGTISRCQISNVQKGKRGSPGELSGNFLGDAIGTISKNESFGIYGYLFNTENIHKAVPIEVADRFMIKEGGASILCDVDGNGVKSYSANIEKISKSPENDNKGIVIKVTDPLLIEKTGGIVQGMSGSPILQNGKLVGAVTHVFVNDPTRGYGIFIENMLAEAEKIK